MRFNNPTYIYQTEVDVILNVCENINRNCFSHFNKINEIKDGWIIPNLGKIQASCCLPVFITSDFLNTIYLIEQSNQIFKTKQAQNVNR